MYRWRQLNPKQRQELLDFRRQHSRPWHSPPHWAGEQSRWMLSAACYEHRRIIGLNLKRLEIFSEQLLSVMAPHCHPITAWCVLPNHYHALVHTHALRDLLAAR